MQNIKDYVNESFETSIADAKEQIKNEKVEKIERYKKLIFE